MRSSWRTHTGMSLAVLVVTCFARTDHARRVYMTTQRTEGSLCQCEQNLQLLNMFASMSQSLDLDDMKPSLTNRLQDPLKTCAQLLLTLIPVTAFMGPATCFRVGSPAVVREWDCLSSCASTRIETLRQIAAPRRSATAPRLCVWELDDVGGGGMKVRKKPRSAVDNSGSRKRPGAGKSGRGAGRSQQRVARMQSGTPKSNGKCTVAVIGGGIAGLSCAQHLQETGNFLPVVFDTGRLRPGGRCSSRLPGDLPQSGKVRENKKALDGQIVDHAAQILTTSISTEFAEQVTAWEKRGVLSRFPAGSVVEVGPKGRDGVSASSFELRELNGNAESPVMYYGTHGMGSIASTIAENAELQVEQDVWVSPSNGVTYVGGNDSPLWRVKAKGQVLGDFDRLVIAHNGKCADRLMSKTPATKLHSLLRVNFAPKVPPNGGQKMTLNSLYSLVFAVNKEKSPLSSALPAHVMSAFIKNEPTLRFMSVNSRKYSEGSSEIETYTVFSSAHFAKKYKAPQEFLPADVVQNVTTLMLEAVERAFSLKHQSLSGKGVILDSKLQLWGAAVPLNTWSESPGFVFDDEFGVGACGDWLLDPSLEGAWESGRRLARWMDSGSASAGLPPSGQFKPSKASLETGLGSFGTRTSTTA